MIEVKAPVLPAAPVILAVPEAPKAKVVTFNAAMHIVKSSSVQAIGFDPSGVIGVTYNSGKTFVYQDCTPTLFNQIAQAQSVGSVVKTALKGKAFSEIQLNKE